MNFRQQFIWRTFEEPYNNSDASGGSASRNLRDAAKDALMRAAASTQTFGALSLLIHVEVLDLPHRDS